MKYVTSLDQCVHGNSVVSIGFGRNMINVIQNNFAVSHEIINFGINWQLTVDIFQLTFQD